MNTLTVTNEELELIRYALDKTWNTLPCNDEDGNDCGMLDLSNTIDFMVEKNKKKELEEKELLKTNMLDELTNEDAETLFIEPPEEFKDKEPEETEDDLNYQYREYLDNMEYNEMRLIIKNHVNPNLPLKRHKKIVQDLIMQYLRYNQGHHAIYRKGSKLQYFAGWDDRPHDFYNNENTAHNIKGLRTLFKNDMLDLYKNDGELFKQRRKVMSRIGMEDSSISDPELETEEDFKNFKKIKNAGYKKYNGNKKVNSLF